MSRSKRLYGLDLTQYHKVIVGEGESDRNFLAAFCANNGILGFDYAFTGMHSPTYDPSGFDVFDRYLPAVARLSGFPYVTDVVLVCDSAEGEKGRVARLKTQIQKANATIGSKLFSEELVPNVLATTGAPRLHLLMIPANSKGGLETVCVDVARDHLNASGAGEGTKVEAWVDQFANSACSGWTTEKRDKLRLQAFISAAWKKKPEMHFSQLFDITGNQLVPLDSPTFVQIRSFLQAVEKL